MEKKEKKKITPQQAFNLIELINSLVQLIKNIFNKPKK